MDEIVEDIKEEMKLLDNKEKGAEFRKELGVDGLSEEELLKYKISFIIRFMGRRNLYCIERKDYFNRLFYSCVNYTGFYYENISCILPNNKLIIFAKVSNNNKGSSFFYMISDDGIKEITLEEIEELFNSGMKSLSLNGKDELIRGQKSKKNLAALKVTSIITPNILLSNMQVPPALKFEARRHTEKDINDLEKYNTKNII